VTWCAFVTVVPDGTVIRPTILTGGAVTSPTIVTIIS